MYIKSMKPVSNIFQMKMKMKICMNAIATHLCILPALLILILLQAQNTVCLSTDVNVDANCVQNRRNAIVQGGGIAIASSAILTTSNSALAFENPPSTAQMKMDDNHRNQRGYRDIISLLDSKTISWTKQPPSGEGETPTPSWNKSRYRSSTLMSNVNRDGNADANANAPRPCNPTLYPEWMEGYWNVNYKFIGASFPQGRGILSLRTAGAGLGTCLSLPNVGYNPPGHAARFLKCDGPGPDSAAIIKNININMEDDINNFNVYEDLAYNIPRRFEAFWPQSKVLSVQTNGGEYPRKSDSSPPNMSPKCFVTGEGCTGVENRNLHLPASRFAMDFDGPTRRSGRMTQSCDVSLIDSFYGVNVGDTHKHAYAASKTYSQFLVNQELQTFYNEIVSLEEVKVQNQKNSNNVDGDMILLGKIRVAAFLPKYIKEFDAQTGEDYDENSAVAIYDYKILMKKIDEIEASNL